MIAFFQVQLDLYETRRVIGLHHDIALLNWFKQAGAIDLLEPKFPYRLIKDVALSERDHSQDDKQFGVRVTCDRQLPKPELFGLGRRCRSGRERWRSKRGGSARLSHARPCEGCDQR